MVVAFWAVTHKMNQCTMVKSSARDKSARDSPIQIAVAIAADSATGIVANSHAMAQCIREDIGALYAKYHLTKTAIAVRILEMNKEVTWTVNA